LRWLRVAGWSIGVGTLLFVLAGCSLRDDPSYNRYAPNNGDPTLLQRAERLVDSAEDALDNGQQRLENVLN
jgi:hypothetical protein